MHSRLTPDTARFRRIHPIVDDVVPSTRSPALVRTYLPRGDVPASTPPERVEALLRAPQSGMTFRDAIVATDRRPCPSFDFRATADDPAEDDALPRGVRFVSLDPGQTKAESGVGSPALARCPAGFAIVGIGVGAALRIESDRHTAMLIHLVSTARIVDVAVALDDGFTTRALSIPAPFEGGGWIGVLVNGRTISSITIKSPPGITGRSGVHLVQPYVPATSGVPDLSRRGTGAAPRSIVPLHE